MTHPDLPAEQAYLDAAYDCLDRMRETLLRTAHALRVPVVPQGARTGLSGAANALQGQS